MPGSSSKEISQIQHKLAASCALASLLQAQQVFACPTSWRGQVAWPQSIYFRPKNTLWWLEEQGEPWKNQREGLLPKKRELKKTPDWQNDYTYKLFDVAKLLLGPFWRNWMWKPPVDDVNKKCKVLEATVLAMVDKDFQRKAEEAQW
jgi:hypothetical protein